MPDMMELATETVTRDRLLIREAADPDARPIAALISQLGYPSSESEISERLAGIRGDPTYRTLVCQVGTAVVGVVGVGLARYYERNGLYARLLVLAVDDAWRNKGIGRALVEAAENWARAQGVSAIVVNSGKHRRDSHRFYERAGYTATGIRFVKTLVPVA